ncbi:hypothetical protein ABIC63_001871 [Pseudacidovorax sp. 1753]|uniref:hypothetical protein n=1 Tax=unclassified Pseudacidovorax TaxID=2620592 RepID=UPI001B6BD692|nr:hypothetical protein [Pseudacidovorax sp.]MBP6896414.1 hypothetical protein [Pseudacidovorax sp.]
MTARHAALSRAADPACIAPGECLLLPVSRGTLLFAVEGHVRVVEAPRWVAEQMLAVSQHLDAGQAHQVDAEGWVQVLALDDAPARVARLTPTAPTSALAAGLQALWRTALARLARVGRVSGPTALR